MIYGSRPRPGSEVSLGEKELPAADIGKALAAGIAYVTENRMADGEFLALTISENLSAANLKRNRRHLAYSARIERAAAREVMASYSIRAPSIDARVETLSGGTQQKLVVARALRLNPAVLLLDEPTQGVDVGIRASIHADIRAATARGTAVIIASSDDEELGSLCDRVIVLEDGAIKEEKLNDATDPDWIARSVYGATLNERRSGP